MRPQTTHSGLCVLVCYKSIYLAASCVRLILFAAVQIIEQAAGPQLNPG
jgi:hypothetical protein